MDFLNCSSNNSISKTISVLKNMQNSCFFRKEHSKQLCQ